jgi:hypothetical protein
VATVRAFTPLAVATALDGTVPGLVNAANIWPIASSTWLISRGDSQATSVLRCVCRASFPVESERLGDLMDPIVGQPQILTVPGLRVVPWSARTRARSSAQVLSVTGSGRASSCLVPPRSFSSRLSGVVVSTAAGASL